MKFQNVSSENCEMSSLGAVVDGKAFENDKWLNEARVLSESIRCAQQFSGETFVIKYDGAAMKDKVLSESFASDVVLLKQIDINPVVVHGGEHRVREVLAKFDKGDGLFVNEVRVIDSDTLEIVEMVLSALVNKEVVQLINENGGFAVGISGKDACLVEARKTCFTAHDGEPSNVKKIMDMGFVGEPNVVNTDMLFFLEESDFIPVVSPVCNGPNKATYVVSPDLMAGAIGSSVSAAKLIIVTDDIDYIKGLCDKEDLSAEILADRVEKLLNDGSVQRESAAADSMLRSCVRFVRETCGTAHIVDGTVPHVLLSELFTTRGMGIRICCDFNKD
ncbi:amino acid kinase family protein [Anaplasma bovis]|uniref:amino acid kinase family protein n=1 Tax=Anaplasma bovis TaxID=186733 RepID=UPI002FF35296